MDGPDLHFYINLCHNVAIAVNEKSFQNFRLIVS
jgi:hypothetical protein